ncbi:MAG TPA: fibrobacter succinogenes major paralogous domain-containing protein [Fibrobacteraceae bacterium]|nr:fibrobacter succinogenes major paralogous domain-containing protein [Fibrobacteraceae bacterium]
MSSSVELLSSGVSFSSLAEISSSNQTSSSSSEESSSSVAISYGTLTDTRDEQTYKTVLIGTQTWMAENLNYGTLDEEESWCYLLTENYCKTFGRLYSWTIAMGIDTSYNHATLGASNSVQGICPSGWHVPSSAEWDSLINYVGGEDVAGIYLKATSSWRSKSGISNLDTYGFSALAGGTYNGLSEGSSNNGFWWMTTEYDAKNVYVIGFGYNTNAVVSYYDSKTTGHSLRCVED